MAALQCEICGGKLIGRAGGLFECDSCGMEFDTAWVKEKIQEIKGTVKVEGTVEVQGTVKVEGGATAENFLKRGNLALEDGKWEDARNAFDEALNLDAECAEAYLGKLMAELWIKTRSELKECEEPFDWNSNYQKAIRFAGEALREELQQALTYVKNSNLEAAYDAAVAEMNSAYTEYDFKSAAACFESFGDYKDSEKFAALCYRKAEEAAEKETEEEARRRKEANLHRKKNAKRIAIGHCTIGLRSNGTLIATKYISDGVIPDYGAYDLSNLTEIVSVVAGARHTVGLCADGTVVALGDNEQEQCEVEDWTDIVAISAGNSHTVGLCSDGTVVAVGDNSDGQCNVSRWQSVVAVAAGAFHTVGLCSNGTVLTAGKNNCGQREVSAWSDIVAVAAGRCHTVGLRSNGTVVATAISGEKDGLLFRDHGQSNVSTWHNIIAVASGHNHTVGLRHDGTVIATGDNMRGQCKIVKDWKDIVSIFAGSFCTIGLKVDGTLVVAGNKETNEGVSSWQLFDQEELKEINHENAKPILNQKLANLKLERTELAKEQTNLQAELPTLKGLFSSGRRKEVETRLAQIPSRIAEIDSELARLEKELAALE